MTKKLDDIDFLAVQPEQAKDKNRQLKEAINVLSSYSHAADLLAEALQNATDAIDTRLETDPEAPARILITFNVSERRFSVADTGTGISQNDVRYVLTPNVTMKVGDHARSRKQRSRGEKGVGLTFLALASNYLSIETSDGKERQEVVVQGAQDWVSSQGQTKRPKGRHEVGEPNEMLGSDTYTVVTLAGMDADQFDDDLFAYGADELIWKMRTQTAVGNTRYLFEEPFNRDSHSRDIQIDFRYIDDGGQVHEDQWVPYAYATPEELLPPDKEVIEFSELADLPPEDLSRRVKGAAVRYRQGWERSSGREIDIYAFAIDGDLMGAYRDARLTDDEFFPKEWQGIFVATRDMATGVPVQVNVVQPRTYLRRMFVLIQDDEMVLDLGRKSLHGRTRRMLEDTFETAWKDELRTVIPKLSEGMAVSRIDQAALKARIDRSKKRRNLGADVPYMKQPENEAGVLAIFHEILAGEDSALPRFETLATGVFSSDDSLVYTASPNGKDPAHTLFGFQGIDIVDGLEKNETSRTASLAVVWEIGEKKLLDRGVTVTKETQSEDGVTHSLRLLGLAGLDSLRVISLKSVLEES